MEPNKEGSHKRAGFSSYPNRIHVGWSLEPPRILCNTIFHRLKSLPSKKLSHFNSLSIENFTKENIRKKKKASRGHKMQNFLSIFPSFCLQLNNPQTQANCSLKITKNKISKKKNQKQYRLKITRR